MNAVVPTLLGAVIAVVALVLYLGTMVFQIPILFWVGLILTPTILVLLIFLTSGGGAAEAGSD